MELPVVSALEFEQIKSSIKNYLKTKTDFTDYDFEGSNLSMLVDVLTYNTLYTSYNVNMAANELNLDTAVLRDNVVSIAKRLGYRSGSYTSSKITANITVNNVSAYDYVRLESGKVLTASNNGKTYTFLNRENLELNVKGKTSVTFTDVELYEGTEYSIQYTVDSSNEHQRFFVPNNYVDAETIRAFVITDPTNTVEREYSKRETIVNVSNSDEVFFVEEVQDQKYEVVFGDDVIGRKLRDGEIVKINYIVTAGGEANNIKKTGFKFTGKILGLTPQISTAINYSQISWDLTTERSDGGSEYESIRSIKYRAPRYYASQERAVTLSDYESIIQQIYPNSDLVKVVGGESLVPPQYGKVFITIKPLVGESVSIGEKDRIKKELDSYKVGSVEIEILDPLRINIIARPTIIFDSAKTRNREFELTSLINATIQEYISDINFNNFGGEYSDLSLKCKIKDLDDAIKFVSIPIFLSQPVDLESDVEKLYVVDFYTSLNKNTFGNYYVISDPFCHRNVSVPVYIAALAGCDADNSLYLITESGQIIEKIGEVDPDTGRLEFTLRSCQDDPINIRVVPEILDIIFGSSVVPDFIVNDPSIIDNIGDPGDRAQTLNPDISVLPPIDSLTGATDGDTDAPRNIGLISSPGGSIPFVPIVTSPETPEVGILPISDPNNYSDIENYTPETNPYSCSWNT